MIGLGALLLALIVAAALVFIPGDEEPTNDIVARSLNTGVTTGDAADQAQDGPDDPTENDPSRDQSSSTAPPISGPATTQDPGGPTTAMESTTVTVEANPVDPDVDEGPDGGNPEGGNPEEGEGSETEENGNPDVPDPANTVPTIPPDTDGTCRLSMDDLAGRSGVVTLDTTGTCAAVGVVIVGVNPRDDLATTNWGRDIQICTRHPAAEAIAVEAISAGGSDDLADGLSRDPERADAIESIVITFSDQDSPITGPRPIASCRTATAELSIVHQPVR